MRPSDTTTLDQHVLADLERKATGFIDERHLGPDTAAALHEWYRAVPGRPFVFRDFLRPSVAKGVASAMEALPVWSRCATIYEGSRDSAEIDEAQWAGHPLRAARHFVGRPLQAALEDGAMAPEHVNALRQFLAFAVLTDVLRNWLASRVGVPLQRRTTMELACYRDGDEIRPHQDLFPGRIMAVNFYLDQAYRVGTGGRLGLRNEEDQEFTVDPLYNSFSLIPVREGCWHWVEPFREERMGRYTVSIGQHHA
ncbi:2OG-Fe(II) oxygenase [Micromonospora sp. NPDC004336]